MQSTPQPNPSYHLAERGMAPIRASGVRIGVIGARPDAAKARIGAPTRRTRSQGADGPRSAPAAILVPRLPLICCFRIAEDLKTITRRDETVA